MILAEGAKEGTRYQEWCQGKGEAGMEDRGGRERRLGAGWIPVVSLIPCIPTYIALARINKKRHPRCPCMPCAPRKHRHYASSIYCQVSGPKLGRMCWHGGQTDGLSIAKCGTLYQYCISVGIYLRVFSLREFALSTTVILGMCAWKVGPSLDFASRSKRANSDIDRFHPIIPQLDRHISPQIGTSFGFSVRCSGAQ